jgi:hypothetical protein
MRFTLPFLRSAGMTREAPVLVVYARDFEPCVPARLLRGSLKGVENLAE